MKKIYTLIAGLILAGTAIKAQDTLLFEDFELNNFYTVILDTNNTPAPGNTVDSQWYNWDADGIPDGSSTGTRPGNWFAAAPYSDVDAYETSYGTPGAPDTNTVLGSNSWNNNGETAAGLESNWLITSNIQLGAHDTLFWKSAPSQTPRYCDGYEVLLSTTTNDDWVFTNVLFTAAEMTALGSDSTYSTYTFSPAGAFVHGFDGTYIDPASTTSPILHNGRLHPFSKPLDTWANQNVFIAFHHNSHDDNLISIDDVMIRGTLANGIKENKLDLNLNVFPNPSKENAQLNFELISETSVAITLYDITGKIVYAENKGSLSPGRHFANINTSVLAKGFYTVAVQTSYGISIAKVIVQ